MEGKINEYPFKSELIKVEPLKYEPKSLVKFINMGVILEETISDNAISYLKEMEKFGGEISCGNIDQDFLNYPKTKKLSLGRDECHEKKLIYKSDRGGDCYIRYAVTKKGKEVLKKSKE